MAVNADTVDPFSIQHGLAGLPALRNHLHELVQKQAALSEIRAGFLVERAKLVASAKDVRNQRRTTADAEVVLMNSLREYWQEHHNLFPLDLHEAYDKVMKERDALGVIEDELLAAERTLSGLEWSFLEREDALYQYSLQEVIPELEKTTTSYSVQHPTSRHPPPPPPVLPDNVVILRNAPPPPPPASFFRDHILIRNPPPPPPPPPLPCQPQEPITIVRNAPPPPIWLTSPSTSLGDVTAKAAPSLQPAADKHRLPSINQQYRLVQSELDALRKQFDTARHLQGHLLRLEDFSLRDTTPHSASATDSWETCSELLDKIAAAEVRLQRLKHDNMQCEGFTKRRTSEPIGRDRGSSSLFETSIRAQTEGMISSIGKDPNCKLRIRDWLLDYVKSNAVERTMYSNILAAVGVNVCDADFSGEQLWPPDESGSESSLPVELAPVLLSTDEVGPAPAPLPFSPLSLDEPATGRSGGSENVATL